MQLLKIKLSYRIWDLHMSVRRACMQELSKQGLLGEDQVSKLDLCE